jgi:curved DNA-binding protein CbpA
MTTGRPDPYETLGVTPGVSDEELRATYRRLVQLHHPDHNGGSTASARRFEEVQEAYAQVRQKREAAARTQAPPPRASTGAPAGFTSDPAADARLADLEREIREAHAARERARQAARAAAEESTPRPTDEELGYVTTDDSLGKILADARAQFAERFAEVREPAAKRVADLLDDVASKLSGGMPPRSRE